MTQEELNNLKVGDVIFYHHGDKEKPPTRYIITGIDSTRIHTNSDGFIGYFSKNSGFLIFKNAIDAMVVGCGFDTYRD